jgi:nitrogen fixation protein FixH
MEQQRTPVEARSGVISGRVVLVLVSSFAGAIIAVAVCWALFLSRG